MRRRLIFIGMLSVLFFAPVRASWFSDVTHVNIDVNKEVFGTGMAAMATPSINALEESGHRIVKDLDDRMAQRIKDLNAGLQANLDHFSEILASSIHSLDQDTETRIKQFDEVLENRFGQIDTMAVKQSEQLERLLRRVIVLGCVLVFLACALWRVYVRLVKEEPPRGQRAGVTRWRRLSWVVRDLALVTAAIAVLIGVTSIWPPLNAAARLKSEHEAEYQKDLKTLNLSEANFHALQLRTLEPTNPRYAGLAAKAALIRDILARPALRSSRQEVAELDRRFAQVQGQLGEDPDVDAIGSFIVWQSGATRKEEKAAAGLAARAFSLKPDFSLAPVALQYLDNYLMNPLSVGTVTPAGKASWENPAAGKGFILASFDGQFESAKRKVTVPPSPLAVTPDLYAVRDKIAAADISAPSSIPLLDVVRYNELFRRLYRQAIPAYVWMVRANTRQVAPPAVQPATSPEALAERTALAKVIVDAWKAFNASLTDDPDLKGSPTQLAAFRLNDGIGARAAFYLANPTVAGVAPNQPEASAYREAWFDTLVPALSPSVLEVVKKQERAAFVSMEARLAAFENSYLQFRQSIPAKADEEKTRLAREAALGAAELGLFTCAKGNVCVGPYDRTVHGADVNILAELESSTARDFKAAAAPTAQFAKDLEARHEIRSAITP